MTRRAGMQPLSASPVLVGAVTLLVSIVAVFLSYNANAGLPFVPTYDLEAELPNSVGLVKGNEVRIGGARVGLIDEIEPVPSETGDPTVRLGLKLDKSVEPVPVDSTIIVRPRSALGLKYVELTPGASSAGFEAGSTIPIKQATPEPVEIDELFNTFDPDTRRGARESLNGFGTGLAGRGRDLNEAIGEFNPLLERLEPVASNLANPRTRLNRLFRRAGRHGGRGGARGRGSGGAVREHGYHVHGPRQRRAAFPPGLHLGAAAHLRRRGRGVPQADGRSCATAPRSSGSFGPGSPRSRRRPRRWPMRSRSEPGCCPRRRR